MPPTPSHPPPPHAPPAALPSGIDTALQVLSTLSTEAELEACLTALSRRLGFDYFSFILSEQLQLGLHPTPKAMITTSYPASWRARYQQHRYHQLDPVVTVGCRMRQPFFWGSAEYLRQLSGQPRRLFDEARDFGIRSGFTVPVYGPAGECGLFSVSSASRFESFQEAALGNRILLQLVGAQVHATIVERLVARPGEAAVKLTEHERICLSWTIRGKTAWEISQILNRSRPTIDFHLQKAIRKLGATNKIHAAFKALQAGLI